MTYNKSFLNFLASHIVCNRTFIIKTDAKKKRNDGEIKVKKLCIKLPYSLDFDNTTIVYEMRVVEARSKNSSCLWNINQYVTTKFWQTQ